MNVQRAIDRATDLCERIAAADFAPRGRHVRLLPYSAVAHLSANLSGGCCGAWTSVALDLLLRDYLQLPEGQRAFCAVVNDDAFTNEAELIGVCLHELSHDIADLRVPLASATGKALGPWRDVTLANLPSDKAFQDDDRHHQDRFTRCCIHVARRASLLGWNAGLSLMNIPKLGRSRVALGDEPREREAEPISSILDSPSPAAFSRLWGAAA